MIDRHIAPAFGKIEAIDFLEPGQIRLGNGIDLHSLQGGIHDLLRIDIWYGAGTHLAPFPLVAQATVEMLQEGSRNYSAAEIAETFDYYGAIFKPWISPDTAGITLYTLTRHLDPVLRVVHSMLTEPLFEEGELAVYLQKKKQAYLVEMKRVSFRARKQFAPALYGEDHPYGRVTEEADFGRIRPGTLEQFHRQAYLGSRPAALVSGRISQAVTDHIGEVLSGFPVGDPGTSQDPFPAPQSAGEKRRLVPVPGSLQSAIRIGRVVENRHHPDYLAMEVLNTLLGGYFGSRLMKNIREDKGFTYGIGSFILPLHNAGTFGIVSEVGASHSLAAISECYAEMEKLREEPVENEELEIVRNYMMGEMVRDFDGPFSTAESYRAVLEDGLDFSHYRNMIRAIRDTGPEALQELAGRILLPEAMTEVVAGDPAMIEHA